jgi:hypothetical protein
VEVYFGLSDVGIGNLGRHLGRFCMVRTTLSYSFFHLLYLEFKYTTVVMMTATTTDPRTEDDAMAH